MTNQEIIERLRTFKVAVMATAYTTPEAQEPAAWVAEAINGAISALKGPTREQVEKIFPGCEFCNVADFGEYGLEIRKYYAKICCALGSWRFPESDQFLFCPKCGKPLSDSAVEIVVKRLEEMQNDQ